MYNTVEATVASSLCVTAWSYESASELTEKLRV